MPFKSEKQKRFFYSRAAGKPAKKGEGDLSPEVAQRFINDSHGEVEKIPHEGDFGKKPKFAKIISKMKKGK